jgi:hypothetical protein
VVRLAALAFSSPIAMWKLQNEFRVPRTPARIAVADTKPEPAHSDCVDEIVHCAGKCVFKA